MKKIVESSDSESPIYSSESESEEESSDPDEENGLISDQEGGDEDIDDAHLEKDVSEVNSDDEDGSEEYDAVQEEDLEETEEEIEDDTDELIDKKNEDEENLDEQKTDLDEDKECYYKKNEEYIVLDEEDTNIYEKIEYTKIPEEERISGNIMTYYELVRIIGVRAQQFNYGAKPFVEGIDHLTPPQKAYVEVMLKMTPFIIRRNLPGKKYEEWKIGELEIIHKITDEFFVHPKIDLEKMREKIR